MVQINFAQKQVNAKIVYYGPGMSGKTTNLEIIHQRAPKANRGELTSISTDGDRTLFFDFMPLDLGTVAGMRTCFQVYTVPGQVYYNSTRKLVLQGVDGVIFVADSSASMLEENLQSMQNLAANLAEYGRDLSEIPIVIQYNKRDLPDAMPVEELDAKLNPHKAPAFEGIAHTGQGVFPTLKALAAGVIENIHNQHRASTGAAPAPIRSNAGSAGETLGADPVLSRTAAHASGEVEQPKNAVAAPAARAGVESVAQGPSASMAGGAPDPEPDGAIPSHSRAQQGNGQSPSKLRLANRDRKPADGGRTATRPTPRNHMTSAATAESEPTKIRRPGTKTLKRPENATSMKLASKRPASSAKRQAAPQKRPATKQNQQAGAAPLRRAPRPTTVQKKGGRSALITGIIVVASVGIGAVLGSLVLSIL